VIAKNKKVSVLKSMAHDNIGISASVYALIYSILLKASASKLLLFLAIGVSIVCLILMYFIRPCTSSGEDSSIHVHFIFTQASSILLATYLIMTTILSDMISINDAVSFENDYTSDNSACNSFENDSISCNSEKQCSISWFI